MRLAYFSPMPPARTGIATDSRELVTALRRHCDVTVFTHTPDAQSIDGVEIFDFFRDPSLLKRAATFDRVLHHIGNNPWYHLEILKALEAVIDPELRQNIVELQLVPIRSSVHIPVATLKAHYQGADDDQGLAELERQANTMIDDLLWWTGTLKAAREGAESSRCSA